MRILKLFVLITVYSATAVYGQVSLTEVVVDQELSLKYEFLGKRGGVTKSTVDLVKVPGASPIPTAYKPLQNTSSHVVIDAIYYGPPIFTFKVPIPDEEQFKKARILVLWENAINPVGYEWKDCTITPKNPPDDGSEARREIVREFLPNFVGKRVSCITEFRADNYFAVVRQLQAPPEAPFTTLKVALVSKRPAAGNRTVYAISVRNEGTGNIGEVNLASNFDIDTRVVSMKPSQGACKEYAMTPFGRADVCHLGALAAGKAATIEFTGESSGMPNGMPPGVIQEPNFNWSIRGYIKQYPADPNWPVNWFSLDPLH
jgi:hypothetical protein